MLTRCLFCRHAFPANGTVERFPISSRVAYDAERGRLWAVCPACGRWTLAPIESRWEALEELDRLTTDRARLLARTDAIALLVAGDVEIVRVGRANLREEAWWRYGRELLRRRDRARRIARRGAWIDSALILLLTGIPIFRRAALDGRWVADARDRRLGRHAWRGALACERCGHIQKGLLFGERDDVVLAPDPEHGFALATYCVRCGRGAQGAGHLLTGRAAQHALRRMLAYTNFAGSTEEEVGAAARLIERFDSVDRLVRDVAERRFSMGRLTPRGALALEIALSEARERELLEMELAGLESRWREEEEVARIADGELTPVSGLKGLLDPDGP